jgi:DNA-binding SARP family transcriptional activator
MITLRLLGTLDAESPEYPAASELLGKPSPTALLAYLALSPGVYYRRDHLVSLFWPETDQARARSNLRKLIHTIRSSLGDAVLESRGDEDIRLASGAVRCDAAEFQVEIAAGRLARAMELYRGPLLRGFHLEGAAEFGRWLDDARRRLARDAAKAAITIAERHVQADEHTQATNVARFIGRVGDELEDEYLFRKLLTILEHLGDRAGALRIYEGFEKRLWRDYQALPAPETRALIARIKGK